MSAPKGSQGSPLEPAKLLSELAALGDTRDAVAATLKDKGIKGYRNSLGSCPVARYLRTCGYQWAYVMAHNVTVGESQAPGAITPYRTSQGEIAVLPSEAVSSFIIAFDQGMYPEVNEEK